MEDYAHFEKFFNKLLRYDYGYNVPKSKYKLLSVEELRKYKKGICWDFTLTLDYYSTFWNIKHNCFFMQRDKDFVTHTFVVYTRQNTACIPEPAWGRYKGYNYFNSVDDAIFKYADNFLKEGSSEKINLFKFKCPSPGLTSEEFLEYVYSNGEEVQL